MMKWFRAHMKQIMAFLVLVAMFSFVGGSALVTFLSPNYSKVVYGKAFGQEMTTGEVDEAQRDVFVLDKVAGQRPEVKAVIGDIWQFGHKDLRYPQWFLLAREAERSGIEVSDQELDEQMQGIPPEYLERLRHDFRITTSEIRRALRRQLAIEKNGRRVTAAAVPSESQVRHYVRDTEDKVKVRFVALDAEKFIDEKEPVSEDELRAHFEKYKNEDPDTNEDGFGYRFPQRVKLQYVVAEIPLIAPGMEVSLDAVKSSWKSNKAKYKKVIYVDPPTSAPATSGPTTGPASQPEKPKPISQTVEMSFSEAQPAVERDLRQRAAQQAADQAMRKIQSLLQKPWLSEKTDPDTGYKPIPATATDADAMKAARDRYAGEFKIPLDYGETPLASKEQLSKLPKIAGASLVGAATNVGGGGNLSLTDYAFHVPPFFQHTGANETAPSLQLFQVPDLPLTTSTFQLSGGNFESVVQKLVLFRVVEAREAEAPTALDEVRTDVEHDLRKKKAFERMGPTANELYAASMRLGVEPALDLFPDLREKQGAAVNNAAPFARMARMENARLREMVLAGESTLAPTKVPGVGASKEFIDACFEMTDPDWTPSAMAAPQTDRIQAATTRPAALPTPKVRVVALPNRFQWFVVELIGKEPVDEGQYESKHRQTAFYELMSERNLDLRNQWFKPERIEKRCGFEKTLSDSDLPPVEGLSPAEQPMPMPQF